MLLTTRQYAILRFLLEMSSPESAAMVASHLGLTPRMLRYDLLAIERWLRDRNADLVKKPNYGLFIDAPAPMKEQFIGELDRLPAQDLVASAEERLRFILLSLLSSDQPMLVKQLALKLQVSHPTILKDLDRVGCSLKKYDLDLVRRPNFGVLIEGCETNWRKALLDVLLDVSGPVGLLALCRGVRAPQQFGVHGESALSLSITAYLQRLDLSYCRRLVAFLSDTLGCQFTDDSCATLVLHLALMMERLRMGKAVVIARERITAMQHEHSYPVARLTMGRIERKYRISVSEDEVAFLVMQLSGASIRRSVSDLMAGGTGTADRQALELADQMVAEASLYLHPYLKADQQLIRGLAYHLEPILHRLRGKIRIRNPLLRDIRQKYPYVFNAARHSCLAIEREIGMEIPIEEVGYIAMHLGAAMERLRVSNPRHRVLVVCAEGSATAWLIVSRLQAQFPDIEIVQVLSLTEAQQKGAWSDVDLVISTSPVSLHDLPVVVVNPLLEAQDQARLRQLLGGDLSRDNVDIVVTETEGPDLCTLLNPDTVRVRALASAWPEVVDLAGGLLLSTGAIEADYVKAMKGVILNHGPYVVLLPGIALLHARPEDGVRRLGMALITLRSPIPFGHPTHDPVGIAIALAASDRYSHVKALTQLVRLLREPVPAATIREAASIPDVLAVLNQACSR